MKVRFESPRYVIMSTTLGGLLALSRFIEPDSLPDICLFRIYSGKPCLFCGLTHAFHAIMLGDFEAATNYHPLAFLAFGLVVFHLVLGCLRLAGWKYPAFVPRLETSSMVTITLAVFTIAWAVRSLYAFL